MNLAISNIAWQKKFDIDVYKLMKKFGFRGLEVAPTRLFDNPLQASNKQIQEFIEDLLKFAIKPISMQSLLYGYPELTIFDNESVRNQTLKYLLECIILASKLNIKTLVFGSPKNRRIGNLVRSKAEDIAYTFFSTIGKFARDHNTIFCIEPNPVSYGADFITTTEEAIDFVRQIDNPGIKVNFDTGTAIINKENVEKLLGENINMFGHVHISEPDLLPIDSENKIHRIVANVLKLSDYKNFVSIEMRTVKDYQTEISNILQNIARIYQS